MGGKGGFAEVANRVIPPQVTVRSGKRHQSQPTPPPRQRRFLWGGVPVAPVTSAARTWEELTVVEEGTPAAARGTTALRTCSSTGDTKGGAAAEASGAAAAKVSRFAGSVPSRVQIPPTAPIRFAH